MIFGVSMWYYISIVLLIACSAFFSACEMAYSSANRIRLENAMESGNRRAQVACYIFDRFEDALSALLIGNNLVNMAMSSIATVIALLIANGSDRLTAPATAIITLLVIIFGETVPKIVAKKNSNRLAIASAYPVRAIMLLLSPFVSLVVALVRLITKGMPGESETVGQQAVEELVSIIETVEDEGIIDEERSELLQAAIDFSDISASEAMTARVDMDAIDIDDDWAEIMSIIESSHFTRVPVYENSIDNIIGVLSLNHFYKACIDTPNVNIRSLLLEPCYVYKAQKLPLVLAALRHQKMQLAIVTDDYGGTMGIITIEDLLEQIVGDIWDDTDTIETESVQHGEGFFEIAGDMTIGGFWELLDREEDAFSTESATVGGWTLECFGGYPNAGDSFISGNLHVTVLGMDGLRVEKVLVVVLPMN